MVRDLMHCDKRLSREDKRGGAAVRFAAIVVFVVLLALVGLFAYGLTLEPEVRTIEQEAIQSDGE